MELLAALEALRTLAPSGEPIRVVSDSLYVVKCFLDKWWVRWERNGWRNTKKQPVANDDLWKPLVEFERAGNVEWQLGEGAQRRPPQRPRRRPRGGGHCPLSFLDPCGERAAYLQRVAL